MYSAVGLCTLEVIYAKFKAIQSSIYARCDLDLDGTRWSRTCRREWDWSASVMSCQKSPPPPTTKTFSDGESYTADRRRRVRPSARSAGAPCSSSQAGRIGSILDSFRSAGLVGISVRSVKKAELTLCVRSRSRAFAARRGGADTGGSGTTSAVAVGSYGARPPTTTVSSPQAPASWRFKTYTKDFRFFLLELRSTPDDKHRTSTGRPTPAHKHRLI